MITATMVKVIAVPKKTNKSIKANMVTKRPLFTYIPLFKSTECSHKKYDNNCKSKANDSKGSHLLLPKAT